MLGNEEKLRSWFFEDCEKFYFSKTCRINNIILTNFMSLNSRKFFEMKKRTVIIMDRDLIEHIWKKQNESRLKRKLVYREKDETMDMLSSVSLFCHFLLFNLFLKTSKINQQFSEQIKGGRS